MLKGQIGITFPGLRGVTLNDKVVNVPNNNGKATIVAIAFDRSAEDALKKWLNPIYSMFIVKNKEGSNFDMAELYDINFYFIPMHQKFLKFIIQLL